MGSPPAHPGSAGGQCNDSTGVAHTVYELAVPDLVRKESLAEHLEKHEAEALSDLSEHQDKERIRRAFVWLGRATRGAPESRHPNFVKRHGDAVWIPTDMDEFGEYLRWKEEPKDDEYLPAIQSSEAELRAIVAEEGARAEYEVTSKERLSVAWVTALLYATGGVFLVLLLVMQACAVLDATR